MLFQILLFSEMRCYFPLDASPNAKASVSLNTEFYYDDTVTMICDHGFWFSSEGGKRLLDFRCDETGNFDPPPEFTYCNSELTAVHFSN